MTVEIEHVKIYDLLKMSNDNGSSDGNSSDPTWSSKNREVTYEQGNRVLAAQKEDINDIDDKALRTVRITALIIGVGATGLQTVESVTINESTAVLSLFLLFLSLVFGVLTYTESAEIVGPTADYLNKMRDGRHGSEWEKDLLIQLPGWVSRNQEKVERNARVFSYCQAALILGVGFGAAALIPVSPVEAFGAMLLVGFVVIVLWILAAVSAQRDHPN